MSRTTQIAARVGRCSDERRCARRSPAPRRRRRSAPPRRLLGRAAGDPRLPAPLRLTALPRARRAVARPLRRHHGERGRVGGGGDGRRPLRPASSCRSGSSISTRSSRSSTRRFGTPSISPRSLSGDRTRRSPSTPFRAASRSTSLMKVTGWQPHSVRGFLSGTLRKKMGLQLESSRSEGHERSYRIRSK